MIRFRGPTDGIVGWDDKVKGRIRFSNAELDDLIIARPDGTPTYNFCVVVDDWDMGITHVIRGDDHVEQHAAPDQHPAGARRAGPDLRARLDDPRR